MNLTYNASEAIEGEGVITISTKNTYLDQPLSAYDDIKIGEYREKILVVDDEKIQREISCKILDALGYESIAVPSGEEAVKYLKEHAVDLLLLDMIMAPGINGRETYQKIIEFRPKQKAIIFSGFVETEEVNITQKLGAGKFIKKPLTMGKIGQAIKEELKKTLS